MNLSLAVLFGLAGQGIPVSPNQSGKVMGTLRTAAGTPAVGVRVGAIARPENVQDVASAAAIVSLAETDTQGRYTLDGIPPGRYYIAAGRVDRPTYYPGAVEIEKGKDLLITPGIEIPGMDFVLLDASAGRAVTGGYSAPTTWTIPVSIAVERGAKLPVFAAGRFPTLRLTRVSDSLRIEVPVNSTSVAVPIAPADYRVTVEGLPEGYHVKSIVFDTTNLMTEPLRFGGLNANVVTVTTLVATGTPFTIIVQPSPGLTSAILVTLAAEPVASPAGVRVAGLVRGAVNRSIYLSGRPGLLFADGTFEFRGVLPGRYNILTLDSPGSVRPMGASIVVADKDIENLALEELLILPFNANAVGDPLSSGSHPPGAVALASVRGRVVEETSGLPLDAGRITVNTNSLAYALNTEGRFEIPRLLPGTYNLEIWAYGVGAINRTIVLDDTDILLDLAIRAPN